MITTATKRKTIGQILLSKGLINQQGLDAVLEQQKAEGRHKLLGELLVEQGLLTEEQLCETLAELYNVPYAKVSPLALSHWPAFLRQSTEGCGIIPSALGPTFRR